MGDEWNLKRLADVATITMGQSPPGSSYNEAGEGVPFYQGVKDFGTRHPAPRVYCTAPTRFAEPGDILFSVRAPIGEINRAAERCCIGRGLAAIRGDDGYDTDFLEYVLRSIRHEWRILDGQGAVFGNAKKSDLGNLEIPWPEKPERDAIARILGTLDDKIELNRRTNETLEAMAQALFKSWFVDFDPVVVNAIRAGNPIPDKFAARAAHYRDNPDALGLPEDILCLFPARFVDSELGPIPERWEVKALGDVIDLAYGKALKASDRRAGAIPVYGSNGQVGWHDEFLVPGPGIVVGRKGNPGLVTWVHSEFFPIDTTFYVVPKHHDYSLYFLFYALSRQDLPQLAADSAVPGLNRHFVYAKMQAFPPLKVADTFTQIAVANKKIQSQREEESRILADLRDTLLPKLISGELRVPDVEKVLEDGQ